MASRVELNSFASERVLASKMKLPTFVQVLKRRQPHARPAAGSRGAIYFGDSTLHFGANAPCRLGDDRCHGLRLGNIDHMAAGGFHDSRAGAR
jgi:hypothetical protein